jgi:transposase-like protein
MNNIINGNHVAFDLVDKEMCVCPHCQSGFIIITIGVSKGIIIRAATCTPEAATVPLYCPYCGEDMKDKDKAQKAYGRISKA